MNFLAILPVAWRALMRHKMRSTLTTLGIIIGVGSVIAMVAIGSGARTMIEQQVASLGANTLMVFPGSVSSGGLRGGLGSSTRFTEADAKAIADECPSVAGCTPFVSYYGRAIFGNQNWPTRVGGVYPSYADVRDWAVSSGKFITEADVEKGTKVCVLGQTVVDNLFPDGSDPVGTFIRIRNIPFRVIGVLEPKGQSPFGSDQDDQIIAPFTTVQRRLLNSTYVSFFMCSATTPENIYTAQDEIAALLKQRHKLAPDQDDAFTIRNQADLLKAQTESSGVMQMLLGAIASISLLVGGIGIMNIMLVSVTERTREIGIRMAVGAKARHILMQFLVEAVVLSLGGGLLGVALGIGTTELIAYLLSWPTLVSTTSIVGAFGAAGLVGIFFGFYPATKAANLDPIDALRYE
ncbi:MAG: FtsX-like permease family protein [Verrucomicrobia bacterium]|nr:FtsX-like permease family protein [Verrucomicrobiota bacterium]